MTAVGLLAVACSSGGGDDNSATSGTPAAPTATTARRRRPSAEEDRRAPGHAAGHRPVEPLQRDPRRQDEPRRSRARSTACTCRTAPTNTVSVIDPATMQVVDTFRVGINPQHVVPSWDLKTLWVTNNAEGRTDGTLTPIDPTTGKPGQPVAVDDPYNMYFTPDGKSGDRRRRGAQAPRLPRPAHDGSCRARSACPTARHQPRRLLDRRQVRDLHLRVRRQPREDRHREPDGRRLPAR